MSPKIHIDVASVRVRSSMVPVTSDTLGAAPGWATEIAVAHVTTPRLHRAVQPDRVEHGGRREVAVRQLPDEARLHHVGQSVVYAAVGASGSAE